jgi:putative transcription factor
VIVEGARMEVCHRCRNLGTPWIEPVSRKEPFKPASSRRGSPRRTRRQTYEISESLGIVENYGVKIKNARRKMGLSHEDIGRKIGEKVSLLKKIEREKMVPSNELAAKLEHLLKIKLISEIDELEKTRVPSQPDRTLTLGDIVQFKNKKDRRTSLERKQS